MQIQNIYICKSKKFVLKKIQNIPSNFFKKYYFVKSFNKRKMLLNKEKEGKGESGIYELL